MYQESATYVVGSAVDEPSTTSLFDQIDLIGEEYPVCTARFEILEINLGCLLPSGKVVRTDGKCGASHEVHRTEDTINPNID